jgi:hypothetical protein
VEFGAVTIPEPLTPEQRPPKRGMIILIMAVVVAVVAAAAWWVSARNSDAPVSTAEAVAQLDPDARAPEGVRVRVRVLNTTNTRGLARRVTNFVRDLGFDVVEYANADSKDRRVVTTVLVHTGNMDWARRLARGLETDSIEVVPDSSRYVDLTVLIGSGWKTPASQPFRP